jgi:hypothetical protein
MTERRKVRIESEEGCKQGGPVRDLLEKIIYNKERFFDKREILNSDGRKALVRVIKNACDSKQRFYLRKALKDPTFHNLLKIYNILFEEYIYKRGSE